MNLSAALGVHAQFSRAGLCPGANLPRSRSMKSSSSVRFLLIALLLMLAGQTACAQDKPSQPAPRFRIPDSDEGLPGQGPIRRYDWFLKTWNDRRTKWA